MTSWLNRIFGKSTRSPLTKARRRPSLPLHLEELENRVVPAATVQFSTGSETINETAGTFSIPVTLTGTPTPTVSTFATGFNLPTGEAFDAAGNLYVGNPAGNTVSRVTPAGAVSTFASGISSPEGLAFDAAGNLYVANNGGGTVSKVTPDGWSAPSPPDSPPPRDWPSTPPATFMLATPTPPR